MTEDVPWQNLFRKFYTEDSGSYQSASGNTYSSKELEERMVKEIKMMRSGEHPAKESGPRPVPRIQDSNGNYVLRDSIDREYYDLLASNYRDYDIFIPGDTANGDTFVSYAYRTSGVTPHQGFKLRVSSTPNKARQVAKTVLPYLQENDIRHKIMPDTLQLSMAEGTQNEAKFITIYPRVDTDKKSQSHKNSIMRSRETQVFIRGNREYNRRSINSNLENSVSILTDLKKILGRSDVPLTGPSVPGKNGTEIQIGNTRFHYRYAHHFRKPAVIIDSDGNILRKVGPSEGLVNQYGRLIEGEYIGDKIKAAESLEKYL